MTASLEEGSNVKIRLTIKNYRCFSDICPAAITIGDGFTAIIGVNNAGKSALLRFFHEFRALFQQASDPFQFAVHFGANVQRSYGTNMFTADTPQSDAMGVFCNANDRPLSIEIELMEPDTTGMTSPHVAATQARILVPRDLNANWRSQVKLGDKWIDNGAGLVADGQYLRDANATASDQATYMTPLHNAFKMLANAFYIGPFRNALNVTPQQSYFDIVVGTQLIQQWGQWKTGTQNAQNLATHKLTSDIEGIFRFKRLEINPSPDHSTLHVFVDGQTYRLPELGSGLAQFFLVLANAATRTPKPSFILIDEPELNLHPSLQLDFLTTLGTYAEHGVIFATHSIGLARAVAHPIYSVVHEQNVCSRVSELEDTTDWPRFIGELSFSGQSDLGFDTLLLVEGKTDVLAVQQLLRVYGKDHQVMVWPMHGRQSINQDAAQYLSETKRITNRVRILVDSERAIEGAALEPRIEGFVTACNHLGIECHVLERRAIENYLSDRALKVAMGAEFSALGPYQVLADASRPWAKKDNWRIAREMSDDELDGTDLGTFLRSL
jgi:ABC-type cobalamin/Fe3+-siderophores transport system ATPase subunit